MDLVVTQALPDSDYLIEGVRPFVIYCRGTSKDALVHPFLRLSHSSRDCLPLRYFVYCRQCYKYGSHRINDKLILEPRSLRSLLDIYRRERTFETIFDHLSNLEHHGGKSKAH